MEIKVPVSPSPRAKKAWKPSRRVPRYHIWCGRRLHISSAGVAAWKGCGYSMRISSSSRLPPRSAHPCPFLGLTLAPAHDTSVSDIWARRNDAALDAAQPAYNTRPTAPGKAASSNSPAPTCIPLHVEPVPECVPCVSRVNVNTTDATTGATALLLPAPCVSRVCPGSPRCLFKHA
jgi:hypothetical protein